MMPSFAVRPRRCSTSRLPSWRLDDVPTAATRRQHTQNTDTAQYYELTQSMAALFNSYALQLLTVARVMVQLPATTRMGESRTWGPMNGGADPLTLSSGRQSAGEAAVCLYAIGPQPKRRQRQRISGRPDGSRPKATNQAPPKVA